MASFTIAFDKPDRKYKAGDTIHCNVQVIVSSRFKARSLSVLFKGNAHTGWSKYSHTVTTYDYNGATRTQTVNDWYTDDEEYFKFYQYIFGNQGANPREIEIGTYHYDVSFTLPANIPSRLIF